MQAGPAEPSSVSLPRKYEAQSNDRCTTTCENPENGPRETYSPSNQSGEATEGYALHASKIGVVLPNPVTVGPHGTAWRTEKNESDKNSEENHDPAREVVWGIDRGRPARRDEENFHNCV